MKQRIYCITELEKNKITNQHTLYDYSEETPWRYSDAWKATYQISQKFNSTNDRDDSYDSYPLVLHCLKILQNADYDYDYDSLDTEWNTKITEEREKLKAKKEASKDTATN